MIRTAFFRDEEFVALQPTVAFSPPGEQKSGCSGKGGIRTYGRITIKKITTQFTSGGLGVTLASMSSYVAVTGDDEIESAEVSLQWTVMGLRVAERVGFEPTVTTRATTVFETAPIGRSGTSPILTDVL
jgi:hypothetical protein